jgi:transglutaminase-like putative cysteine protease
MLSNTFLARIPGRPLGFPSWVVAMGLPIVIGTLGVPSARAQERQIESRRFELEYSAKVAEIPSKAAVLDLWLPLPQSDRNQTIDAITINSPGPVTIGRDSLLGNVSVFVRVKHPKAPVVVSLTIQARRTENAGSDEPLSDEKRALYLKAEPLVPLDGPVRALAIEATRGLRTDAEKAKALYDKVVSVMKYDKSGTGWGRGDAIFACDAKRGNCTDFHALLIGMARSVGIPARFAIGLSLPASRGEGAVNGYHCWAELYVAGRGWVPVDASEAAKNPAKREYYFGHHDANRLEFSRGRQVTMLPAQQGKPLNFFIEPYAEIDGRPYAHVQRTAAYRDLTDSN